MPCEWRRRNSKCRHRHGPRSPLVGWSPSRCPERHSTRLLREERSRAAARASLSAAPWQRSLARRQFQSRRQKINARRRPASSPQPEHPTTHPRRTLSNDCQLEPVRSYSSAPFAVVKFHDYAESYRPIGYVFPRQFFSENKRIKRSRKFETLTVKPFSFCTV